MNNIFKILLILLCLICTQPTYAIKIGLFNSVTEATIGTNTSGVIVDNNTHKILLQTTKMTAYKIRPYQGILSIEINGRPYKLKTNSIVLKVSEPNGFVFTKKRWYRGELIVKNIGGFVQVVNKVPLEEYIMGVVPSEMPSKWNFEAHRAQAIAARSYALSNLGKRAKRGYDLTDTPQDQAYRGASAETQQTNLAVRSTEGIVMTYNNKIISAYYHSSSGGHTVQSGAVWAKNLPYLKSVESYDWGKKKFGHGVGMSQYGANNLAGMGYGGFQILNHFYNNVSFAKVKNPNLY
ncbi:SpoIID/LytB domain-containing protein [bacterium]|nr:SpoIID/LytB domain-containing protein [bacterium]